MQALISNPEYQYIPFCFRKGYFKWSTLYTFYRPEFEINTSPRAREQLKLHHATYFLALLAR